MTRVPLKVVDRSGLPLRGR